MPTFSRAKLKLIQERARANNLWNRARSHWLDFLERIDTARNQLGCFHKNAWFRGHSRETYQLIPSLLRLPADEERSFNASLAEVRSESLKVIKELIEKKNELSKKIGVASKSLIADGLAQKDERNKLILPDNPQTSEIRSLMDGVRDTSKKLELARQHLNAEERRIFKERQDFQERFRANFLNPTYIREIESDLFIKYSFRSERTYHKSSWEILAEMRHYGVPTRLLDWTESLSIAVYFAVEEYGRILHELWNEDREQEKLWNYVRIAEVPSVWVLNPYVLSLCATDGKRSSIWDFSFDDDHDYYSKLLRENGSWRYQYPIPIYPPWTNRRIAAQHGVFTVHGTNPQPLEQMQVSKMVRGTKSEGPSPNLVERVVMTPEAAMYAVRHLRRYEGLTEYQVFRDSDRLGKEIRKELESTKTERGRL